MVGVEVQVVSGVLVDLTAVPMGVVAGASVLAQNPAPPPGEGAEFGKASPVALVVIVLLALATIVLVRSMSKRIRRLPTSFDSEPPPEGEADAKPAQAQVPPTKATKATDADAGKPDAGTPRRDAEDAGGARP